MAVNKKQETQNKAAELALRIVAADPGDGTVTEKMRQLLRELQQLTGMVN